MQSGLYCFGMEELRIDTDYPWLLKPVADCVFLKTLIQFCNSVNSR